ncbi:MAG: response regulator [Nitrospinae bacterium]|nr:response regulator [Nitrospinota bacterium]
MYKILIVEDSSFQRKVIHGAVARDGREIAVAPNVPEALQLIEVFKPDIILSDILMPGMTGIDMLQKLKELNITVPVIMISADIQEPVRQECMKLGAIGFISKPLAGASLTTLQNILDERLG